MGHDNEDRASPYPRFGYPHGGCPVSERSVEKHVGNIFSKLGLAPSDADHRRVLAALRYLQS